MTDRGLDPGYLEEPALRARVPLLRRRPLLPAPEVVLLLDSTGRIARSSIHFAGERLSRFEYANGHNVHDVFHEGCDDDCELKKTLQRAWTSHQSGLPVEWLWLSPRSDLSLKLRLQPVSYACGVLFGDSICSYDDHSVLFVQDLDPLRDNASRGIPAERIRMENAALYLQRRSGDRDPDLVASLDRRLRIVTGRLLAAEDEERRRLAAELHDGLGQSLSLLRLEVESVLDRVETSDASNCRGSLERVYKQVKASLDELRDVTSGLHSRSLSGAGLLGSLDTMIGDFRLVKPEMNLDFSVTSSSYEIPTEIGIAIYRIVQEGLNNIFRHSEARNATVELSASAEGVRLWIEDDGVGVSDDQAIRPGLGMITMRERTRRLSGEFDFDSAENAGCRISIHWPVEIVRSLGDETVFNGIGRDG